MNYSRVSDLDIEALRKIIPAERFFYPTTKHYDHDQFNYKKSAPDVAVQPVSNDEVSAVMKYANEHQIPVTVRGNATGLMGANISVDHGIAIDMIKMNKVLEYDPDSLTMTVQAGVRIRDIDEYLADQPFIYVPSPAMKWAAIGGNLNTNAGGMKAVKYGTTREHVRGLTAILADGTQIHCSHKTVKNSSGYDIKDLIIGSEGTLAVVTEVVLRLIPRPRVEKTMLLSFPDIERAISCVPKIFAAGLTPTSVEYFSEEDVDKWEEYSGKKFPVKDGSGYLMIGFDGNDDKLVDGELAEVVNVANENDVSNTLVLTADDPNSQAVWDARSEFETAIQQTTTKMDEADIVVPINKIPLVLKEVRKISEKENVRLPNFGHAGDGNLHIYICCDDHSDDEFAVKKDHVFKALYQVAKDSDGEMSGEHGIGFARKDYFEDFYGSDYVELMSRIKLAFDPNLILNPDKIFPLHVSKQENEVVKN